MYQTTHRPQSKIIANAELPRGDTAAANAICENKLRIPSLMTNLTHGDYRLLQPTAHHRAVLLLTNGRYERRGGDRNAILARPWATPSRSHRRRTWQPATKYILYSGILARSSASKTTRCTRLVWNVASRLVTLATSWPLHTLPRILSI